MNLERLQRLCSICGVSSNEESIRVLLEPEFKHNSDEIKRDNLGSVFAYIKNRENAKTLMIACPMDECGMMVSGVNEDGTLSFIALENIALSSLLHQRVTVLCRDNSEITGVITKRCHVLEDKCDIKSIDDLVIDCGYASSQGAKVLPGDLVSYKSNFDVEENVIYSKALNPRVLNEVCIEVLERLKGKSLDFNVAIGTMSQSMIGFRGTKTATYVIKPDVAIALTLFQTRKDKASLKDGVIVGMYDKGMIPNQRLLHDFMDSTKAKAYFGVSGNDSSFIHKTVKGCPSIAIGIACCNVGSSNEMVSVFDVDSLVDTLVGYILHLNNQMIENFGFGEHHV